MILAGAAWLLLGRLHMGPAEKAGSAVPSPSLDEQVEAVMGTMSRAEKLGQMVMIGIHGTDVTTDSLYMLQQYHIGGVLLFDRNLQSSAQVQTLTQHLQEQAAEQVPLFIGIDEEGGQVVRGRGIIPAPPSQAALGSSGDAGQAETWAAQTAASLQGLGINVNFAPVADVGSPDTRSFSQDAPTTARFVQAAARGYASAHQLYVLKHFPGIGRGRVDSHQDISSITASQQTLMKEDLLPFRSIIAQQHPEGYFILVSHLRYPAFDKENPASQSPAVMTGLLRRDMHYEGIIITDDMEMGAAAKHASYRDLGVRAVQAGADIVMICHEYQHEADIYLGLLDALDKGTISQDRVDESVRRIIRAKLLHLQ
jgi:beta-N-acetylhexosaminidase